jgi:hypothetical protein
MKGILGHFYLKIEFCFVKVSVRYLGTFRFCLHNQYGAGMYPSLNKETGRQIMFKNTIIDLQAS